MELCDITVRVFMRCLFNKDYTGVENWEELYTKYIDLSGLGEEGQLGLHVAIHNLNVRLIDITGFLEFQTKVYNIKKEPHIDTINDLQKYGHRITWNPENDNFIAQLNAVEAKEKRNYVEMKRLNKELKEMQEAEKPGTVNARNSFVIMLNVLGKEGYKIDRDTTDIETLALMIKQHGDDVRALENQKQ